MTTTPYDEEEGAAAAITIALAMLGAEDRQQDSDLNTLVPGIIESAFGPADDAQSWARAAYAMTDLALTLATELAKARAVHHRTVTLDEIRSVLVELGEL